MPSDIKTFIADVDAMREAQRRYFRTRELYDLDAARALERRVDAALEQLTGRRPLSLLPGGTNG